MQLSERAKSPSPLLDGIFLARRPTGPVLALVVLLGCLFVGQAVALLVLALVTGAGAGLLEPRLALADQMVLMLAFGGTTALLWLWIRFREGRPFGSVGFLPASRVPQRLALGAAGAAVALSIPVLANVVSGQFTMDGPVPAQAAGVLLALAGFAVQASTEEIVTRGYLLQTTYRKWGLTAAVVVQAVVFTALHGANAGVGVVPGLNLALISLLLVFWALAEGGLWGVCAFHAVWNWFQGNVFGVEVSGMNLRTTLFDAEVATGSTSLLTGGQFGVEGSLITSAVLAVGVALAVIAYRRTVRTAG
ncbi:CPBP family intramembrane glutamic endopeptidase [Saccharopolyspora taberi]|uniref:Type II CAAX endopeptidase family protein n=1 Tax=Saccharopolyspora taberi TaxID=60895 RepID=A0ABN3V7F8_9PSEU